MTLLDLHSMKGTNEIEAIEFFKWCSAPVHFGINVSRVRTLLAYDSYMVISERGEPVFPLEQSLSAVQLYFYKMERKTHPSECGWDVSDH